MAQEIDKKDSFDPYALSKEYASYLGIKQKDGESDVAFKSRIAGELRKQGNVIEAHEAYSGRRYDDPDQGLTGPMTGIMGAVSQLLSDKEYSPKNPEKQIGDDIAAGILSKPGGDSTRQTIKSMLETFGPEASMDLLRGMSGK